MVSENTPLNSKLFLSDLVSSHPSFGDAARDVMTRKKGVSYYFAGGAFYQTRFGPMTTYSGEKKCHVTLLAPMPRQNNTPDLFLIKIGDTYGVFKGELQ